MAVSARGLRAGRAVIELSMPIKAVERSLRALQGRVKTISRGFLRIGSAGILGGGGGFGGGFAGLRNLFVGSAATAALAWPVKMAANIEMSAAAMSVFTGSADSARAMLLDLQKFSAISLIPFENLSDQAAMFLQFGIAADKVNPAIKALTTLARGNADEFEKLGLAYAQVASAGRLQGEEMRQFKNTAFNPLREIAERTGETMLEVRNRMEAAGVSFEEVEAALLAATGAGGRFNGLLETISATLIGQLNKAIAQFKLAILPLGDTVLPALTRAFRDINALLPVFADFVKKNASFATKLLGALAGVAVAATLFVAIGLGFTLAAIAAGGFISVLGSLASAIQVLASPITIAVGALVYLTNGFETARIAGASFVDSLLAKFRQLGMTTRQTLNGVADAIKADDIQLAGRVLWAGLDLVWAQGTNSLRERWIKFKDDFLRITTEIVFGAQIAWTNFSAEMQLMFLKLKQRLMSTLLDIGAFLHKTFATQTERDAIDKITEMAKKGLAIRSGRERTEVEDRRDEALSEIGDNQRTAAADRNRQFAQEMAELEKRLAALGKEFDDARAAARRARLDAEEKARLDALNAAGQGFPFGGAAAGAAVNRQQQQALFDTQFARQIFGGERRKEEIELWKKIEKHTAAIAARQQRAGGVPVGP